MNRCLLLIVLCGVFAAACSEDNVTNPSNLPLVYTAQLSPVNEIPAVVGPETASHGSAQVTFNVTTNAAGTITAASADMYFQLADLPAATQTIVGAHIHPGAAGATGPATVSMGLSGARPITIEGSSGEFQVTNIPVDPTFMQGMINNPAAFYFNVHSPSNPSGFARGQLTRIQ